MTDEYTAPEPWPWRGDSKIGQVQRIAMAYRSLCESLVYGALPNPQAALVNEDAEWVRYGHHWVTPSSAPQPDMDQWVSIRDCAHYVSQYYPCTPRNVHDWINRGHVQHRIESDGSASVRWGSVMDYDQKRRTA